MKQIECLRFIVENTRFIEPTRMKMSLNYDKTRLYIDRPTNEVIFPDMPEGICEHVAAYACKYLNDALKYRGHYSHNDLIQSILLQITRDIFSEVLSHINVKGNKHRRRETEVLAQMKHCTERFIKNNVEKTFELILRLYKYSLNLTPENIKIIQNALELSLKGSL